MEGDDNGLVVVLKKLFVIQGRQVDLHEKEKKKCANAQSGALFKREGTMACGILLVGRAGRSARCQDCATKTKQLTPMNKKKFLVLPRKPKVKRKLFLNEL